MDFEKTFTDSLGRTWTVNLDMRNDDRLEAVTGVSLVNLVPQSGKKNGKAGSENGLDAFANFMADPYAVFDAFYSLVEPQATAMGLDKKGVKAGMDEASAQLMAMAVLRAIHDFFPRDAMRQASLRQIARMMSREAMQRISNRISNELNKIDIEKMIDGIALEQTKSGVSGSLDISALTHPK